MVARRLRYLITVYNRSNSCLLSLPSQSSLYSLDCVYGPDESTESVYEGLVAPLMPLAWGGGIGTIFAYGQTGSGKTFTVSGIEKIVARELFSDRFAGERRICVSVVELAGSLSYGPSFSALLCSDLLESVS